MRKDILVFLVVLVFAVAITSVLGLAVSWITKLAFGYNLVWWHAAIIIFLFQVIVNGARGVRK